MKKYWKSIAKSLKSSAKCQLRNNAMYADSLAMSRENIGINSEVLAHSRDAKRIMLTRLVRGKGDGPLAE